MADMKETSFIILVVLVGISAMYEWANDPEVNPIVSSQTDVSGISDFKKDTLIGDVNTLVINGENLLTTSPLTEFFNYIESMQTFFGAVWAIFMKLTLGWVSLLDGIFASLGLQDLAIIFITPIAMIQLIGVLYFIRDIVNTLRGAG